MTQPPAPTSTIVVAGDLAGDDHYHAGDEAMSEVIIGALAAAGRPNVRIVATSTNPVATARRLRCVSVPWAGFASCTNEDERARVLADLTARLGDPTASHPPLVTEALGAAGVVVAGGGNLNSHWPEHLYERVLLGRVARHVGIPLVITGQTVGPELEPHHRLLAAELLSGAVMVGVREQPSAAVVAELGIDPERILAQADDALMLTPTEPSSLPAGFTGPTTQHPSRFIAVTIHPFAHPDDPQVAALGDQLAAVAARTASQLLFVPHMRGGEGPGGASDTDMAGALAAHTGGVVLDTPSAREAAWAAQQAWVVVSSRYHPVVFATAAGVPALALPCDRYTLVKCGGALTHVGLGPWVLHLTRAAGGELEAALGELTRRRHEVASWMSRHLPYLQWLDSVRTQRMLDAAGLGVDSTEPTIPPGRPEPARAPRPVGAWTRGDPVTHR